MKIAASLNYAGDPQATATRARQFEQCGVDLTWIAELYSFDAVSLLGFLAGATKRIRLMSGVLPIYSRTPTLIAMTAAGLDAVSEGRFVLGLGASGPQVVEGWHGVPYDRPLARTREIVDICRMVWRRERLTNPGPLYPLPLPTQQGTGLGKPLKLINHPIRDRVPIFLASLGPRNVELTAEVAEGWIPVFFHPDRAGHVWGISLAAGRARRSADLAPLEIVAGGSLAFCSDPVEATRLRDQSRPLVALYVGGMGSRESNFYKDVFERYGYEDEARQIQEKFLGGHERDAQTHVPAEFLESSNLIGDEAFIRDRVDAFKAAGVTYLQATPIGPNPLEDLRRLCSLID